jgi:uncharacterized membrane protein YczE
MSGGTSPVGVGGPLKRRSLPVRIALFATGSTLATLCYGLTIRAGMGLGPLFVLQDGLAIRGGFSIGTAVIVTGFAFVAIAMALRSWPGPGTLILPVLGGVSLNVMLPYLPTISGQPLRLVVVVAASWFMGLGGAMMIAAALGVSAYDSVMLGLCRMLRRPVVTVRLAMEFTVFALGWALGGAVGLGTAITAVLIGPSIHLWLRVLQRPSVAVPAVDPASTG